MSKENEKFDPVIRELLDTLGNELVNRKDWLFDGYSVFRAFRDGETLQVGLAHKHGVGEKCVILRVGPFPTQIRRIHILNEGRPLCRFTPGVLALWPEGHTWVSDPQAEEAVEEDKCPGCFAVAEVKARRKIEKGGKPDKDRLDVTNRLLDELKRASEFFQRYGSEPQNIPTPEGAFGRELQKHRDKPRNLEMDIAKFDYAKLEQHVLGLADDTPTEGALWDNERMRAVHELGITWKVAAKLTVSKQQEKSMKEEKMTTPKEENWYCWREFETVEGEDGPRLLIPWNDPHLHEYPFDGIFETKAQAKEAKQSQAPDEEWVLCKLVIIPILPYQLGFEWDNIKKLMEEQEWFEEEPGLEERHLFIGTVMNIVPSGKYYMPWACSNVEVCMVCANSFDAPCDNNTKCVGSTGEPLTGEGHCEVCRDAAWKEQFEKEADNNGYYVTSGEGAPCDIFIGESREVDESNARST